MQPQQFEKVIDDRFDMMLKKQVENPNLIIPKNFEHFIHTRLFMEFIVAVYEYCAELQLVEHKQVILDAEARDRIAAPPQLLVSETSKINAKLKNVSEKYCLIILKMGCYNVMYRDQNFFETLIYFVSQVLREVFDRDDYRIMEQEINRIFRTNTFNLIKKRHFEDDKLKRFPVLRDGGGKETINTIITKMEQRSRVPRTNWKFQLMAEKSDIKPFFLKQTPCASINSRSPLIAMILPSSKERLFQQEKARKAREKSYSFRSRIKQTDLSMLKMAPPETQHRTYLSYYSNQQVNRQGSNSFIA